MTYAVAAMDEAVKHDHFSAAQAFSALAGGLANKCRDTYAARAIQGRTKQIREIQEAWEAVEEARSKLDRDAADAAANAAVGRYLCFSRGDWELGLPLLARGSESQLKTLGEVTLQHSLWAHPHSNGPSRISFILQSRCRCVMGNVIIPSGRNSTPLTFRITGDGRTLWSSPPLHRTGDPVAFRADLCAVHRLELVVDCPGSAAEAGAYWVDPIIVSQ